MNSLDSYIENNHINLVTISKINGWIRDNPYVFIMVYKQNPGNQLVSYSVYHGNPAEKDKLIEYSGAGIDSSISTSQLVADASKNYYIMQISDGEIIVAISEYTENLYYALVNLISIMAGIITFILWLVGYIRLLIKRIKRFQGDVKIVFEENMDYEIISEGRDELANLSTNVEKMRRTMLDHIKSEQEARESNTDLITSISHDIRTPLTVLMGYIEMMKDQAGDDSVMRGYIEATENTAMRLKHLSDDMFKYSLAFGDIKKTVKLEEYDFIMLNEQIFSEHFLLMRENGYDIQVEVLGDEIREGTLVRTDAPNLMRIVDNIFSNIRKYADKNFPIIFIMRADKDELIMECRNKIQTDTEGAESNGIGLKTCVRLGSLVAKKFEYHRDGDEFVTRLVLEIKSPQENEE
jgi:signal transduction histidine kinase